MTVKLTFKIPADHPSLEGHFPEYPIAPGALILQRLVVLANNAYPQCHIQGVFHAKFMHVLQPERLCEVCFDKRENKLQFKAIVDGVIVSTGVFNVEEKNESCMEK